MNNGKIRLLLVDDHPVVRTGVRAYLATNERVEIVGEAADGREAVAKAGELSPDIVFMDTYMPGMNGLDATRMLHHQWPKIKVLMHSAQDSHECALQIIRSGARGCVLKNASLEVLTEALDCVNRGDTYYNSETARIAFGEHTRHAPRRGRQPTSELSDREVQVLGKIADGKSNREIAADLGIGVRTIETHRERIMRKLQIHNLAGLIKLAIAHGIAGIE